MDLLCIAAEQRGYVLIGGRPPEISEIARFIGETAEVAAALLSELETKGVFSRDRRGAIYCRRMIKAEKNRKNGRLAVSDKTLKNLRNHNSLEDSVEPLIPYAISQEPFTGGQAKSSAKKRGSRLAPDWKPSVEQIAIAKAEGLNDREIAKAADEFRNYWCDVPGAKGVKLSWDGTWRNRCAALAERWGRTPPAKQGNGVNGAKHLSREDWNRVFKIFKSTSNWPGPGPAPGNPGCIAPTELCGETLL